MSKKLRFISKDITTMGGVVSRPDLGLDMGLELRNLPNSQHR